MMEEEGCLAICGPQRFPVISPPPPPPEEEGAEGGGGEEWTGRGWSLLVAEAERIKIVSEIETDVRVKVEKSLWLQAAELFY